MPERKVTLREHVRRAQQLVREDPARLSHLEILAMMEYLEAFDLILGLSSPDKHALAYYWTMRELARQALCGDFAVCGERVEYGRYPQHSGFSPTQRRVIDAGITRARAALDRAIGLPL